MGLNEAVRSVLARDDAATQLLELLQDPFSAQLQAKSIWAAVASSIGITAAIALAFSLLRPYNTVVYAPKLKHADEQHAPPRLGKSPLAWVGPVFSTTEQDLVRLVGMDATIFIRFTKMLRNLLVILAIFGCAILIPVNVSNGTNNANAEWISKVTPLVVWNNPQWATVAMAWITNIATGGLLWWNYRAVLKLRRQYFESNEYQQSLHARTLMLSDIPKEFGSDEGIARIIDSVAPNSSFSRTAIARDVKILPELIAEHNKTVRKLEKVLAIYLRDPKNLPPARPTCRPSKKDRAYGTYPKGLKVDAIEYLTERIRTLELEIKEVRQSVDKRSSMPFGFASYADISEAHSIAYMCRQKKPHGARVELAPRPSDIIWENMPLSPGTRSRRRIWNNFWIVVLTLLWVVPNAMIAIFLVNLSNLGRVWDGFKTSLERNKGFWSVVQGIASPAITSTVYLLLPALFRRMAVKAGDQTKTGRDRHVAAKLYSFFVFNNLFVFSMFSAIWTFAATVANSTNKGLDAWHAILGAKFFDTIFATLCNISPFWVTWLLQRQLGAAIDLAQLWTLFYSFIMRKFSSPTPRELIELTAPPPFDYASYYNYFLFYLTVTLCYAPTNALVLPAAALYFFIDVGLKKYLLLYIFVTKTESGGRFWSMLVNRIIFAVILSNMVSLLVVMVRGWGTHEQAWAIVPLPILMLGFKFYCVSVFDAKIHYYATRNMRSDQNEAALNVKEQSLRNDRLAAKFGHPALYKPLITPMVHAKAQNILASVYQGRLSDGREALSGDIMSVSGYSDTYVMNPMSSGKPGKVSGIPGFEMVPESRLDFEYYKNREEFAADHGAGDLFGAPSDIVRSGTPSTEANSRPGTPVGGMGFAAAKGGARRTGSPVRRTGYASQTPAYPGQPSYNKFSLDMPARTQSPLGEGRIPLRGVAAAGVAYPGQPIYGGGSPLYNQSNESETTLMRNAAGMPVSPTLVLERPDTPGSDRGTVGAGSSTMGGFGLPNPRAYGYGGVPQVDDDTHSPPANQDPMQYDYFRGGNRRQGTRDASGAGPGQPGRGA